jgi:hypothetical protein
MAGFLRRREVSRGAAAKEREKVVPGLGRVEFGWPAVSDGPCEIDPSGIPRLGRLPWVVLLKRVFLVDVLECPKCKGRMKILAAVTAPASVQRILNHLGLPTEAPRLQVARPPPQLALEDGEMHADGFCPDPPSPEY